MSSPAARNRPEVPSARRRIQPRDLQRLEVAAHGALRQLHHATRFADAELLQLDQGEQADARGLGQHREIPGQGVDRHAGHSLSFRASVLRPMPSSLAAAVRLPLHRSTMWRT